jgi:hypothetical protein
MGIQVVMIFAGLGILILNLLYLMDALLIKEPNMLQANIQEHVIPIINFFSIENQAGGKKLITMASHQDWAILCLRFHVSFKIKDQKLIMCVKNVMTKPVLTDIHAEMVFRLILMSIMM